MELDRDVDISRVHRLGPYQPGRSTPRPIIVRFLSYPDRESVWSNRSTLKGTRIWLSEDFPNEIDKRRQKLMPYLRAARAGDSDNPQTRVTANLRQDKLFINNHAYTVNNLASLPMFIKAGAENRACVKKTDDITLFYSGNCHFSNFHLASFEVDGFEYSSAEQYLSFKKAMLFNDMATAKAVMRVSDPGKQKLKVKKLKNFDIERWVDKAPVILKTALTAKFQQNDDLKDELLATGDTLIAEASPYDCLFGIGLSLNHPDAVKQSEWRGKNILGSTLMAVRDELKLL